MDLLHLPTELLGKVLEEMVVLVDLIKAVKLRLVCKTFDREIPVAMCNTRLLETELFAKVKFPANSWLVKEHIFRETWGKRHRDNNLQAALLLAAETLAPKSLDDLAPEKEQIVRELCKGVVRHLDLSDTLFYLKPGAELIDYIRKRKSSKDNHLVSAAAYLGDLDFFKNIIAQGKEINYTENIYFGNPLRCAIREGHFDLVKFMLDHNVDVNYVGLENDLGRTALDVAASTGRTDILNLLLEPEYNCNISTENLQVAVLGAASSGRLENLQNLLGRFNENPTPTLRNEILYAGSESGHNNIVLFALQLGANPNEKEQTCSWKLPLEAAVRKSHADVTKTLLINNADFGQRDFLWHASKPGLSDKTVRVIYQFANPKELAESLKKHKHTAQHSWKGAREHVFKLHEYHKRIVKENGGAFQWCLRESDVPSE